MSSNRNDHDVPAGPNPPAGSAEIVPGEPGRERPLVAQDEPPVVARLVVEIRSDGSRTIARGAVEEMTTGQQVAIEARGDSPAQLAWALARSLLKLPVMSGLAGLAGKVNKPGRTLLSGRRDRTGRK